MDPNAGLAQFRPVEMATLDQGNGHDKHSCLAALECELLSALRRRTGGAVSLLVIRGISVSWHVLPNNNPSPTTGACHTGAKNAIRHSTIIRVEAFLDASNASPMTNFSSIGIEPNRYCAELLSHARTTRSGRNRARQRRMFQIPFQLSRSATRFEQLCGSIVICA